MATVTTRAALFQYALIQAVPSAERGECVNVGVIVYSQQRDFLDATMHVDPVRLKALDQDIDVDAVRDAVEAMARTCRGEGPAGATSLSARFGWLVAPRSTVVRTGPVHSGRTDDPAAELRRLHELLVR